MGFESIPQAPQAEPKEDNVEKMFNLLDKFAQDTGSKTGELAYALRNLPAFRGRVEDLLGEYRVLKESGGVKPEGDRAKRLFNEAKKLIEQIRPEAKKAGWDFV